MSDDLVRRIGDMEARVARLEAHRDKQVTQETRRAIRKLIAHRDEGQHVQLVLSFQQVVALADLLESVQADSRPALTGVAPQMDQGQG